GDGVGDGGTQLQVGDALALDWAAAFPAVFARGGFDAVIGNPPYVRQEHLAAHKPQLRGFACYDGAADLYVYFVELAHRLARPGAPHPRERWRADPWHIDAPGDRALLERLEQRWPPLADVVPGRPSRGVVTGYNRAFVLDGQTRERLLDAEPGAASLIRPF